MLLSVEMVRSATTADYLVDRIEVLGVFLVLLGLFVTRLALVLRILLCEWMPTVARDADEVIGALEYARLVFRILIVSLVLGFLIELLL